MRCVAKDGLNKNGVNKDGVNELRTVLQTFAGPLDRGG